MLPVIVLLKMFVPLQVLLFASRVEEAALIVIAALPSKETLLMLTGVANLVAVPALPEIEPVIKLLKVL